MTTLELVLAVGLSLVLVLMAYVTFKSHRPAQRAPGSGEAEVRVQLLQPADRSTAPICANCRFFDLEEGQAAMARYPAALVAYQHISPAEEAEQNPQLVPLKAKWTEMGACSKHNLGVWSGQDPAARLRKLEDLVTPDLPIDVLRDRVTKGKITLICPTGKDCWEPRA